MTTAKPRPPSLARAMILVLDNLARTTTIADADADPAEDFVRDIIATCERHGMTILPSTSFLGLELRRDQLGARREMEDALRVALEAFRPVA